MDYIIYDVTEKGTPPATNFLPSTGWGMIAVSSPGVNKCAEWARQLQVARIIMNCPEEMDAEAMCAWIKRDETVEKQAEYWEMVKKRMYFVGPLQRPIFDAKSFTERCGAVKFALKSISEVTVKEYFLRGGESPWCSEKPSRKLVKIVWGIHEGGGILFNVPICVYLKERALERSRSVTEYNSFSRQILTSKGIIFPIFFKCFALKSFMESAFVKVMATKLTELEPPTGRQAKPCVLKLNPELHPKGYEGLVPSEYETKIRKIKHGVLYKPWVTNFPLVDAFFFMESNPKTTVGLQMATAGGHHTTASTVRQFTECLAAYYNGWEELSRDMLWEMIYVQHADSTPMNGWQRCGDLNPKDKDREEKEIEACWEKGYASTECQCRKRYYKGRSFLT
ncbi:retrotransposon hot spot (RHS) protein, putative [Trypanosoma cruzi marinkellei]|uniref:Retrotransposon hot spot (RHS) protein, putative n=1 Tax=Trypanosoma cruzi marinkellei TaxID=85056 RepID=K2N488_TRYCR|nr:retrotransposon hot spot (RHS) protein, putative [Trypanosoma cruzi marinkellei]